MTIEPFMIETEAEARDYLADLLKHSDNRSIAVIEAHGTRLTKNPAMKALFTSIGADMLAETKVQRDGG